MRVRNRKGATELLEANPQYVVLNPEDAKGKWHEIFGNDHPIISKWVAEKGPLLLGWPRPIQRSTTSELIFKKSVLSYALDKVLEADVPNIKFALGRRG